MPSVTWLTALTQEALRATEFAWVADQIPANKEELRRIQFSLRHSPLLTWNPLIGEEANLNRLKAQKATDYALMRVNQLCKKLKVR